MNIFDNEFEEEEEIEIEEWNVIKIFSNYEISNFGNCRNKENKRHLKTFIKQSINKGYKHIKIKNDDGV